MDPLALLASLPLLRRAFGGRVCARVQPIDRSGVHLHFEGTRGGLRLDTLPEGGAALLENDGPPRLRGGRSAWTDFSGAADRLLAGRTLVEIDLALSPLFLVARFDDGAEVAWTRGRSTARLLLREASALGAWRALPALLPEDAAPEVPPDHAFATDIAALARGLRAAAGALPPADPGFIARAAELSRLGPKRLERIAREAGGLARLPLVLESLADRLDGQDAEAGVTHRSDAQDALVLVPPPSGWTADTRVFAGLLEAIEAWYRGARSGALFAARRNEALAATQKERARVARAAAALAREEAGAIAAETLRHHAGAILSAGPTAVADSDGALAVPDPWDPAGEAVRVTGERPGARGPEIAERLFARARKAERGQEARASRRADLLARSRALEEAEARLLAASDELALDEALSYVGRAGLAVGLEPSAPRPRASAAKRRESAPPARMFRSPGGFQVLAGRTARQNDRLTFKIAGPDDYWLHVDEYPGAHVVVRLGGRGDLPPDDLAFAAGIAAAFSQAPQGIQVDVSVARRKHVKKPRGAPPGLVTVRKSATLRVRVEPPPHTD